MTDITPAVPTPEITEAPKVESTPTPTPTETPAAIEGGEAPPAPAWTPNFKVKSYDKEFEIDEMFRPLMKDAETEKKVRSVFEKSYGLDEMKPKYQKTREENETLRKDQKEYHNLQGSLQRLNEMWNSGDHENFFKSIGVSDEAILNYAAKRLKYMDLTPEKKAEYDRGVHARNSQYALQDQNQVMSEELQQVKTQVRGQEMRMALSQPDVSEVQKRFDAALGEGAFAKEVINQGLLAWNTQGKDISADEAVSAVLARVKPLLGSVAPQAPTQAGGVPVIPAQKPPTIPNINGTTTSPIKQKPKSIDDIRKIAAQMANS